MVVPGSYTVLVEVVADDGRSARAEQQLHVARLPRRPPGEVAPVYAAPERARDAEFRAETDRWRVTPPPYELDARPGRWDPYNQNVLKGDFPIRGDDLFFVLTAVSDTLVEARALPTPARITVHYHDPIDPTPYRALPEGEAVPALLDELRRRVERSLLPGVKADLRIDLLYRSPAPGPRLHEYGPAFALALLVFWKTRSLWSVAPAYAYIAYLLLDQFLIPQRRIVKWVRNASAVFFLLVYAHRAVLPALGLPSVPAAGALLAVLSGALFAYLYERGRVALGFIRGLVLAMSLGLAAFYLTPTGVGPHISLTVFAAAYAWERRTVFWRYTAPLLFLYDLVVVRWLHAGLEVLPHAVAGLLAWLFVRFLPDGRAPVEEAEPPPTTTTLGLR